MITCVFLLGLDFKCSVYFPAQSSTILFTCDLNIEYTKIKKKKSSVHLRDILLGKQNENQSQHF